MFSIKNIHGKHYPWLVIILSSCFLFYKYLLQVSPSIMTNELMRFFHIHGAGLGNLAATFFYAYLITQLFVGPLLDKYSPRLLTSLAILFCSLGALGFSQAHSLLAAELSRGLIGAGAAFATVSYFKMTAVWFRPSQFAFVGGLLATAVMLGSLVGEAPLALLLQHVGWENMLAICGLLGVVLSLLFYAIVRDHPVTLQPTQNALPSLQWRSFSTVLRYKHNWLLMVYSGLAFAPLAVFAGLWGNPFLQAAHHLSNASAASLTSMAFVGFGFGGPLSGILTARFNNHYPVMLLGLVLSMAGLIPVLYITALSNIWVGAGLFLFGLGTGAFMLGFTVGKELNQLALAATVIGLINTGDALFGALTEPLIGKVLDVFWQHQTINGAPVFSLQDFHIALSLLPVYLLGALLCLGKLMKMARTQDMTPLASTPDFSKI